MDIIIADTRTGNTAYIKDGSLITEPDMNTTLEITKRLSRSKEPAYVIGDAEIYVYDKDKATVDIQTLCVRTARLVRRRKIPEVLTLLNSFGVNAVVHLKPADYMAYADKLTELEKE